MSDRRGRTPRRGYPYKTACRHGHPYPESRRPGRSDCAVCHRDAQTARYRADINLGRARGRAYAAAHTVEAHARSVKWRLANPERYAEWMRLRHLAKRVGRDAEALTYAQELLGGPCSYCPGVADTVDHIEPIATGGASGISNITGACGRCNSQKRTTPLLIFLLRRASESVAA